MKVLKFTIFSTLLVCLLTVGGIAQKMKAEDVIAKHLDSIATAEKRAETKSMIAVGEVTVNFVTQKNQSAQGRIVLASADKKFFYGMNLNAADYPSEKFSFDGKKAKAAFVRAGTRSILGNFVATNDLLLEESLLGGTLSTSWSILHLADQKAKLSYDGTKKIDGKEVYAIGYSVKGGGDVNVTLYFDKATFHHVRSEYRRVSSAGIGTDPSQSSRLSETRIKVTEDFSNFKEENGITLPHTYILNYSVSGQRGTTEIEWKSVMSEFAFNQTLTDSTFDAEAN